MVWDPATNKNNTTMRMKHLIANVTNIHKDHLQSSMDLLSNQQEEGWVIVTIPNIFIFPLESFSTMIMRTSFFTFIVQGLSE
jgi:hypothetical protein